MQKAQEMRSNILIVDDDIHNRKLLEVILMKENYNLLFAVNGQESIDKANNEDVDLILLDIMMPKMSGFEVCEILKSQESTRDIPIIFISAKDDRESIKKGFELGAYDFFTKPINPAEIDVKVNNFLKLRLAEKRYQEEHRLRTNTDKVIRIISEETEDKTGEKFFNSLVTNLGEILNIDYAIIGEYDRRNKDIFTASVVYSRGNVTENIEHQISGTPVQQVLKEKFCIYSDNIQETFPEDALSLESQAVSFIGMSVAGSDKNHAGLLMIYHREPITEPEYFRSVLAAFSVRVSTELARKKSEEELREKEEMFRLAFEYASIGRCLLQPLTGSFIWINDSAASIFAYRKSSLMKLKWRDLIHEEEHERIKSNINKLIDKEIPNINLITRGLKKNDETIWLNLNIILITATEDKPLYIHIDIIDITKEIIAEQALRESEKRLEFALQASGAGVYDYDIDGKTEPFYSGRWADILGFKAIELQRENLFGGWLLDRVHPEDRERVSQKMLQLKNGEIKVFGDEYRLMHKSGSYIHIQDLAQIVEKDEQGNAKRVVGIMLDISERKEMQRKILTTVIDTEEKERARFAQDLHDGLGPLLSTAKLYVKSLESISDEQKKKYASRKSVEIMDEAISSIRGISNNISPHILKNFGISSALRSFIKHLSGTNEISIHFDSDIPERMNDHVEVTVFRVVVEMIHNTLKHADAQNIYITLGTEKDKIVLNYEDDGKGFNVDKILSEPSGMGISNIMNRISSLDGSLAFNNKKKKGFGACIKLDMHKV